MIFFVDFDGTICPPSENGPSKECLETLNMLRKHNHLIHIYSCRSNPNAVHDAEKATNDMKDYLDHYNVPYDEIIWNKPYFNYLIDDRALGVPLKNNCVDWSAIKTIIEKENI